MVNHLDSRSDPFLINSPRGGSSRTIESGSLPKVANETFRSLVSGTKPTPLSEKTRSSSLGKLKKLFRSRRESKGDEVDPHHVHPRDEESDVSPPVSSLVGSNKSNFSASNSNKSNFSASSKSNFSSKEGSFSRPRIISHEPSSLSSSKKSNGAFSETLSGSHKSTISRDGSFSSSRSHSYENLILPLKKSDRPLEERLDAIEVQERGRREELSRKLSLQFLPQETPATISTPKKEDWKKRMTEGIKSNLSRSRASPQLAGPKPQ